MLFICQNPNLYMRSEDTITINKSLECLGVPILYNGQLRASSGSWRIIGLTTSCYCPKIFVGHYRWKGD